MTVLDLGNNIKRNTQIMSSRYAATVSTPTALDLKDSSWGVIHFNVGSKTGSTTVYTYTIEESSDNASFTTVKKFVDGEKSTTDSTIVIAADGTGQEQTYMVAFETARLERYLRVTCVKTGGGSDTIDTSVHIVTMPDYTGDADAPSFSI